MKNKVTRAEFLKAGGAVSAALVAGTALGTTKAAGASQSSVEGRVEDLLSRMTLDEKIHMVHGEGSLEVAVGYVPPIERLGIPGFRLTDGPVGVRSKFDGTGEYSIGGPTTAFPATVAAAATWDRALVGEEGAAIASEAKAKDQDVLLGPALDIIRVPRGGRNFEYYSEDPYLTARMTVGYVRGAQSEGVIATAKHYAANNQEADRDFVSAEVPERALREIYLPGYEAAVKEAGVGSVMAAYNKVDGEYMTANERLLTEILKEEWGFGGYVVSDWGAIHGTVPAARAGTDLDMPGEDSSLAPSYFGEDLKRAVKKDKVSEDTLDDKVRRILRQMALFGVLDGDRKGGSGKVNTPAHQSLARRIAAEGTVLLKREDATLPLDGRKIGSIAVIGYELDTAKSGGGSARVFPPYTVSPLEAIQRRARPAGVRVEVQGTEVVPPSALGPSGGGDENGLRAEYFDNPDAYDDGFSGQPDLTRVDDSIDFEWKRSPGRGISGTRFAARWSGKLDAPESGVYGFVLTSFNASRLYLDGDLLVEDPGDFDGAYTVAARAELDAGKHDLRVEFQSINEAPSLQMRWFTPQHVSRAAGLARDSDAALVFAGNHSRESEDLGSLALPGNQDEIIEAVADSQGRTAVVLRTAGPVLMPWVEKVPNLLESWFGGQEEGNAIAAVLFGETNPSGKLPVTFGRREEDYPANTKRRYPGVDGEAEYSEGVFVGYRHFDQEGIEPLFPFGHGLSYTTFSYHNLRITPGPTTAGAGRRVSLEVTNTGSRSGSEVVQLYLGFPGSADEPPRQLKGFEKVDLRPGQTERVIFRLGERDLSYWDTGTHDWVVPGGGYRVMVGGSSRDIRLEDGFA